MNHVPYAFGPGLAAVFRSRPRLEQGLLLLVAFALTLVAEWRIVTGGDTFQADARTHLYWMQRFRDPELFRDPLTETLLDSGIFPHGFQGFYWLVSRVADPVQAGELLPLVLAPFSAWLVFRIVRLHTDWLPAAWLGAILFLLPVDIQRFSGGLQRSFFQPLVLLAVYLLLRGRPVPAALLAPAAVLFYPSAALVVLVVLLVSAFQLRPRFRVDVARIAVAGIAGAATVLAVLIPRWITGSSPQIITEAEGRRYADLSSRGKVPFFDDSLQTVLSQNLSGFNLRWSGSILVCAVLLLLAARPRNALLLRREVWGLAIAGLGLFVLAHLLLFRLYVPQRYTAALIPFCAIFVAVAWRPTWESLAARVRSPWLVVLGAAAAALATGFLALVVFPLGLRVAAGDIVTFLGGRVWVVVGALVLGLALALAVRGRAPAWAAAALVAGVLLVGEMAAAGERFEGATCEDPQLLEYLSTLPKDAVVAGNPPRLDCVPIVSGRAVVINKVLYQPWERRLWDEGRARMLASVEAYYGPELDDILALRDRFGADYLVVEDHRRLRGWGDWAPYLGRVRRLLRETESPAIYELPSVCVTWAGEGNRVYDLACVAERAGPR